MPGEVGHFSDYWDSEQPAHRNCQRFYSAYALAGKESACNAGDLGLIPRLGKFPGEGNGDPIKYSCLENSMDRGAWQAMGPKRVRHD